MVSVRYEYPKGLSQPKAVAAVTRERVVRRDFMVSDVSLLMRLALICQR
jgi:hypothetical protein